jgi:hypothetical protein
MKERRKNNNNNNKKRLGKQSFYDLSFSNALSSSCHYILEPFTLTFL